MIPEGNPLGEAAPMPLRRRRRRPGELATTQTRFLSPETRPLLGILAWKGNGCALPPESYLPPWPNGQGVGLLIRRLRVRVPQGVLFALRRDVAARLAARKGNRHSTAPTPCRWAWAATTQVFADGHTALNAPDLFRPPKLSSAGPG